MIHPGMLVHRDPNGRSRPLGGDFLIIISYDKSSYKEDNPEKDTEMILLTSYGTMCTLPCDVFRIWVDDTNKFGWRIVQ